MESAEAVIIGGGAIGASTLYHLRRLGVEDVTLLERDTLSSGSTGKSAGASAVPYQRHPVWPRSLDEFEHFEERTGAQIDFHQNGYLFLISTPDDLVTFRTAIQLQHSLGVESEELTVSDALDIVPQLNPEGLVGATLSTRRPRHPRGRRLRLCVQLGRLDKSRVCGDGDPGQRRPDRRGRDPPGPNRY